MKTRYDDFIGLKKHLKDVFGIDLFYGHINDYLRNNPISDDVKPLTLEEQAELDYEGYSDDYFDATGEFPPPFKLPEVDPTKVKNGYEGVDRPPLRKPPEPSRIREFPLSRIIVEGTIGTCPMCGSTERNKYYFFGRKVGCYNEECINYYKGEKTNLRDNKNKIPPPPKARRIKKGVKIPPPSPTIIPSIPPPPPKARRIKEIPDYPKPIPPE